ncbi:DUF1349 domain-containing protein [Chloroflexota bacterium]
MKKLLFVLLPLVLVLGLLPSGSALGYVSHRPAYTVTAPEGWKTEPVSESMVRFSSPGEDIRFIIETSMEGPIPLEQYRDLSLQDMSRGVTEHQLVSDEETTLGGQQAFRVQLELVTEDGFMLDVLTVGSIRDGWGYRLSALSKEGNIDIYLADFQGFLDSFSFAASTAFPFSDEFDGAFADAEWYMVRETPGSWSLSEFPGYLGIITEYGDIRGGSNNARNLILRSCPQGDFEITTAVNFYPVSAGQQAGLIIYQDDDNFVSLSRSYSNGGIVDFVNENGTTIDSWPVSLDTTETWLKIGRHDNNYSAYVSAGGTEWEFLFEYADVFLDNPSIGLFALQSLDAQPDAVYFDFFSAGKFTGHSGTPLIPGWSYPVLGGLVILLIIGFLSRNRRRKKQS